MTESAIIAPKRIIGTPFKPGNSGKPKGTLCELTRVKNQFVSAFHKSGGIDRMVEWIESNDVNRGLFYKLLASLFPKQVEMDISKIDTRLVLNAPKPVTVVQVQEQQAPITQVAQQQVDSGVTVV
jgi:hypothetical protein